ncbi:MAG: hypothetical protein MJ252_27220 [archaeon]|nr:hypothetical protein [archaeon]
MEAKTTKSNFNKTGTRQIGRAYNPHLKKRDAQSNKKMEESKNDEQDILMKKQRAEEDNTKDGEELVEKTKEDIAKNLLKKGYIDSFIDFFYLGWQKTPSLISAYYERTADEEKAKFEDNEENEGEAKTEINDELIPRHQLDFEKLKAYKKNLVSAENSLRKASVLERKSREIANPDEANKVKIEIPNDIQNAVNSYKKISDATINIGGIPVEAIYFIEKRINLSKTYNIPLAIIHSLIDMGGCFEKIPSQKASNTSKSLKEEAKEVFESNSQQQGEDQSTKTFVYTKLMDLYYTLSEKQEQMKEYENAIKLLNCYLEVLDKLMEGKSGEELNSPEYLDNVNKKTASYLKIADLYYLQEKYDDTVATLGKIDELNTFSKEKTLTVKYYYFIF